MATRNEQKQQARAAREASERERAARDRRKRRVQQLAAVVALAVIAIVVVVLVAPGGGKQQGVAAAGAPANALMKTVSTELAGISQSGPRLGKASASVKMDYYGDLQCPVCRDFTEGGLSETIADEVRAGELQVTYRSLETATADPSVFAAQQTAALAAGRRNRLWQFIELFYRQQGTEGSGYVDESFLKSIASQTPGLDQSGWSSARKDPALQQQVQTDATAAGIAGAKATPTLVVKGPKGTRTIDGNVDHATIQKAISDVS